MSDNLRLEMLIKQVKELINKVNDLEQEINTLKINGTYKPITFTKVKGKLKKIEYSDDNKENL